MNEDEAKEWTTDRLPLAAYILCEGIEPERIERVGDQGVWVYRDSRNLRGIVKAFLTGKALVDPDRFYNAVRTSKSAMFDVLDARRPA